MSEFRFAEPQFVHWLWGVLAAVALLLWLDQRGGSALDRLLSPLLQARLVRRPGVGLRRARILLLGLAAVCLVAALMRPQWGLRQVASQRVGAEIMIALDVSKSMLAEDVAPNRLERAKAEIADLLGYLRGDQVGLIAFAGRASVLAPLTPDFGFLRLVLDGVGPGSVQRGGTKLEEPIRKAVAGFGDRDGGARALLLITDGEDHDSFPLDAAKAAAEAGVVIIAIGFGDEAGSEIAISDPRTGVRSIVRDADGRPVLSRLDGDLLRQLALETGGAYVPAGTGVLDLESIYEQYIARLTRGQLDERGKTVRDEGYQWFVLLGLVALLASVLVSGRAASAAASILLAVALVSPEDVAAQTPPSPSPSDLVAGQASPDVPDDHVSDPERAAAPEETPRQVYNRGVAALEERDFDEAELLIGRARREARSDGALRFQATYDLGWLAFMQAGRIEGETPRKALDALYRAADWFRDAAAQRPEDEDTRVNLEVTLRRALLLADQLAKDTDQGVEKALEELVESERQMLARLARLHAVVATASDPNVTDRLRGEFRGEAAAQRAILSDADQLASQIGEEEAGLQSRSAEERTPEDEMRAAQLGNVLHYLHTARERMGQARRQLRKRQSERAYRRASASLGELKRALDQLRDPVKVLDALLRDAGQIAERTAQLQSFRRDVGRGVAGSAVELPAWLAPDALQEDQVGLAGRTGELDARLRAGLDTDTQPESPEQAEMLAAVVEAQPFVGAAGEHFLQAASDLGDENLPGATLGQHQGLQALSEARERFLDLAGLIEAAHADEERIASLLVAQDPDVVAVRDEYLPSLRAAQSKNRARADRLGAKLASELQKIQSGAAAGPGGPPPDEAAAAAQAQQVQQQVERMEVAGQLLAAAIEGMDNVQDALGPDGSTASPDAWPRAAEAGLSALSQLAELRRLFFTIVQLVQELAERQTELADVTQDALALTADPDRDASKLAVPLAGAQGDLSQRTLQLANALVAQADLPPPEGQEGAEEAAEKLRMAAEHVVVAQGEMESATETLASVADGAASPPPDFAGARESQDAALIELAKALELLQPPQPPGEEGEEGQDQQDQQNQQGEQDQQGEEDQEPQPQAAPQADPSQMLQGVRDREAQRRRDREQGQSGYDTVEKDW